jgi:hypothetical protein
VTLIDKFEKFPLFIDVTIQQNPYFFDFLQPFSTSNIQSISILNESMKNEILLQLFPLKMRIYLVPQLNILTIELKSKQFKTDQIMTNLILGDAGKQIKT